MVVQRYALAYEVYMVPVFCCKWRRPFVWFLGLIIYGVANGLYAVAMKLAPLSLVASLFTLLLVFNLIFAKLIIGEEPTPPKLLGAVLIIAGATAAVLGQPGTFGGSGDDDVSDAIVDLVANNATGGPFAPPPPVAPPPPLGTVPPPIDFTIADITALLLQPLGLFYFVLLLGGIFASIASILVFERSYGLKPEEEELREIRRESLAVTIFAKGADSAAFAETPAHAKLRKAFQTVLLSQRIFDVRWVHLHKPPPTKATTG